MTRHFVVRAVGLFTVVSFTGGCSPQQAGRDVVGVENRCSALLEVSVGGSEPAEQWTPVASGSWEKVNSVDRGVPFKFWFRFAGDPSIPEPVELEAADVVRSVWPVRSFDHRRGRSVPAVIADLGWNSA